MARKQDPPDRQKLEQAYEHLRMASRGVGKEEFLQRPLKYLRLYGCDNLPETKPARNIN